MLRISFVVGTAYTINDFHELFINNYTCPFCREQLIMTPNIMEFANDFIDKKYHINFHEKCINIINKNTEMKIDKNDSLESIVKEDYFPTIDELKFILNVAEDIDSSKWEFCMESEYVNKPFFYKEQINKKNIEK